jgi:hypothetical protein
MRRFRLPDEALYRHLMAEGHPPTETLGVARARGYSDVQSMHLLRRLYGLTWPEAGRAVRQAQLVNHQVPDGPD